MKRITLLLLLATLMILTLACSLGGEADTPAEEPREEVEVVDIPTDPPQPTATTAPTATTVPPTPTFTPEPEEDLLVPRPEYNDNPCANVLYPLVQDYQYIYDVVYLDEQGNPATDQIGITVAKVENDEATVDMINMSTGIITQSTVSCEDGSLVNFPVIMLNFLIGEVDGELDMQHVDGLFAPSYETLLAENWVSTWTSEYLANGVMNIDVDGETATATLSDTIISMFCEIKGEEDMFEAVEVPAGTFQNAMKLYRETSFDIKLSLTDEDVSFDLDATLTLDMVIYYEPNLGMLKQEVRSANITVMGSTFPIAIEGSMMLKEFRDGK